MSNQTPLRLLSLRLRIWAIERLGGETEDLSYWLWSLTRPPAASTEADVVSELSRLMARMNWHLSLITKHRVEWEKDAQMPRIVTSMAQSADDCIYGADQQEVSQNKTGR